MTKINDLRRRELFKTVSATVVLTALPGSSAAEQPISTTEQRYGGSNNPIDSQSRPTPSTLQADREYDYLAPEMFGAKGDGNPKTHAGSDDTAAVQTALSLATQSGKPVILRSFYVVSRPLLDGNYVDKLVIRGIGRNACGFINKCVGSTMLNVGNTYWLELSDFKIQGNGLSGANGNGHAIGMVDPAYQVGAYLPGQTVIERLWIVGHRGTDVDALTSQPMGAAGIYAVNALSGAFTDVFVTDCQYAAWIQKTFQLHFTRFSATACRLSGIVDVRNENLVITHCDLLDCDNELSKINIDGEFQPTGSIVIRNSWNTVVETTKIKAFKVTAISAASEFQPTIRNNWIALPTTENAVGVYSKRGIRIIGNTFDTFGPFAGTRRHVHLVPSDGHNEVGEISGNHFRFNGGGDITACIDVEGSAAGSLTGVVENNSFGSDGALANVCTVSYGIRLSGRAAMLAVRQNRVRAPKNATISTAFQFSGLTLSEFGLVAENNLAVANGGIVTTEIAAPDHPYKIVGGGADGSRMRGQPVFAAIPDRGSVSFSLRIDKNLTTDAVHLGSVEFDGDLMNSRFYPLATTDSRASGMDVFASVRDGAQQVDVYARMASGTATLAAGTTVYVMILVIG